MNDHLAVLAAERGGWFTLSDAIQSGYSDAEIRGRLRCGRWRRLCRDAYVEPATWPTDETAWQRAKRIHILQCRVVHHRLAGRAVLSHQSAVVLHGLPTWGLDLSRVHVTRSSGRSRSDRLMCCHRSPLSDEDVVHSNNLAMTVPARALVEAACGSSYEAAVVLYDAAARDGLVLPEQLAEVADRLVHWAGSPGARAAIAFMDPRSESVGESRLRVLMANRGLPEPELQVEINDAAGQLVGRVDFLFRRERLVVEFDGAVKYGGNQGTEMLMAEKRREDRIRAQDYGVVRVTWPDLARPAQTAARIGRSLVREAA